MQHLTYTETMTGLQKKDKSNVPRVLDYSKPEYSSRQQYLKIVLQVSVI